MFFDAILNGILFLHKGYAHKDNQNTQHLDKKLQPLFKEQKTD